MNQQSDHPILEFLLPPRQHGILDKAAGKIPRHNREAFRKHVADQLRSLRDPPWDTQLNHCIGCAFLKFGRRL
jgi:hypothetical protein